MKSYIIISENLMNKSAYNMFTRMLLHIIKSTLPVNLTMHSFTNSHRGFCVMPDCITLKLYIDYFNTI